MRCAAAGPQGELREVALERKMPEPWVACEHIRGRVCSPATTSYQPSAAPLITLDKLMATLPRLRER